MDVYQNLLGGVLAPCFTHNIWKENLNVHFVECHGQQNRTENNSWVDSLIAKIFQLVLEILPSKLQVKNKECV